MFKKRDHPKPLSFFAHHRGWIAIATLIGTIIGAGVLGIPYAVAKVGFLYGFLLILGLGLAFLMLNLFMGEIVLRTKEQHQLTGYAEKYLGHWGKRLMAFSMLISIYGALTAYLIGEGTTLYSIFKIGSPLLFALLFFVVCVIIILWGVKATGRLELMLIFLLIIIVLATGVFSLHQLNLKDFGLHNLALIAIPYGVIMFAYGGSVAIPEMQEELVRQKKKLKSAIILGSLIPIFIYILFTFIVMGLVNLPQFELLEPNQRIATIALSIYSHPLLGLFANIMAVLTMFTSFLSLGLALLEVYQYDYSISKITASVLTFSVPLVIILFELSSFINILEITGSVAGGLIGILIILMYWQAKKKSNRTPEYSLSQFFFLGSLLILLFSLGILHQLLTHV